MNHAPRHSDQRLEAALAEVPLIAILRGLPSSDAVAVVQALFDAGIRVAEVPLNSPTPFDTIRLLVEHFGRDMVIGAGTVTRLSEVRQLAECGALLCVSPNTNPEVITGALRLGMTPVPGFQTPSEAFAALAAGASHIKLFPATGRANDLQALRAVLPQDARVVAVGGVTPQNIEAFRAAGAGAFGVGSDLYRKGDRADTVGARAKAWVAACREAHGGPTVSIVCNPHASIGEAPLWRQAPQAVLWVDPVQSKLFSAKLGSQRCDELTLDAAVSSIVELPDGRLAGALEDGFCTIDELTGRTARGPITTFAAIDAGCRFNDMAVDLAGGLWAGTMHKGLLATRGSLYYAPSVDAPCIRIATGLGVPNGMAFNSAGNRLYMIDTLSRNLLAFPTEIAAGRVGEPTIVTDFMGIAGKPDGMAMAPDGSLWVAMWGGGCIVQIAPDSGALLRTIALPAPHVSSLCFDAAGRLWVTTSRMRLSERELAAAPASGALFSVTY